MPLRHGGSCKRFPWSPPKNGWACTVSAAVLSDCPEAVSSPAQITQRFFPFPAAVPPPCSRRRQAGGAPHARKCRASRKHSGAQMQRIPPGTSADGAAGGADEDECNISPGGHAPVNTRLRIPSTKTPRIQKAQQRTDAARSLPKGAAPDREAVRPASGCTPKRPFPGVLRYFVTFSSIELPLSPRAAASARYRSTPCVRLRASSP